MTNLSIWVSSPISEGSSIWLASSMMAREKRRSVKRGVRLCSVVVVATTTRAESSVWRTWSSLGVSPTRLSSNWSRNRGSQVYSLPMRR